MSSSERGQFDLTISDVRNIVRRYDNEKGVRRRLNSFFHVDEPVMIAKLRKMQSELVAYEDDKSLNFVEKLRVGVIIISHEQNGDRAHLTDRLQAVLLRKIPPHFIGKCAYLTERDVEFLQDKMNPAQLLEMLIKLKEEQVPEEKYRMMLEQPNPSLLVDIELLVAPFGGLSKKQLRAVIGFEDKQALLDGLKAFIETSKERIDREVNVSSESRSSINSAMEMRTAELEEFLARVLKITYTPRA